MQVAAYYVSLDVIVLNTWEWTGCPQPKCSRRLCMGSSTLNAEKDKHDIDGYH